MNNKKQRRRDRRDEAVAAWVMLFPAFVLFSVFVLVPTLVSIAMSLFEWHFFDTPRWVGGANFVRMLSDPNVGQSIQVTFTFVILGVVPTILLGFMCAALTNAGLRGVGVLRVLYFIPVVVSVAVSAVLWSFLFDSRQGPIAAVLRMLGITMPDVFTNQILVVPTLTVILIWAGLPLVIILYLAALQRVPPDVYDAAALDGSGGWRTLWSITWPNVSGTTVVIGVLQIVAFAAGALDLALIMTNGGPLGASRALGLYAFQQAFNYQDVGYASALSFLQILIIVSLVGIGQLIVRRAR